MRNPDCYRVPNKLNSGVTAKFIIKLIKPTVHLFFSIYYIGNHTTQHLIKIITLYAGVFEPTATKLLAS